jgi:hypothetical protein
MGFEGKLNNGKIGQNNFKNGNDLTHIVTKFKKDSLQIWFKPIKTDSLRLAVAKDKYRGEFTFKRIRKTL